MVKATPPLDLLMAARGKRVCDVDGEFFGKLVDVYYDKATARPEWLGVDVDLFDMRRILVPTLGVRIEDDAVRVAYPKQLALDTPEVLDREVSQDVERHLYEHYGLSYGFDDSPTGLPTTAGTPPRQRPAAAAWPDIDAGDPLRFEAVDVAEGAQPRHVQESPGGTGRARLRRIRLDSAVSGERRRAAPELLQRYPWAPWFAGALAALALGLLARTRNLRWAAALLRLEAVALLAIAVIEKRRKQAEHEALARMHEADQQLKPSIVQRVKSKVGMG